MWNQEIEEKIIRMRGEGKTYSHIAKAIGKTTTSVKHKVRRIQQNANEDRYKHTEEKTVQVRKYLTGTENFILETHSGWGSLTETYRLFGEVEAYDIDSEKVKHINSLGYESVTSIKADSEREIIQLLAKNCRYSVVDLDPYGFPSRFFPYVFALIDNGLLFMTFPVMGVAQINKITIRHYEAFWGISLADKDNYVEKIIKRMKDYAFMSKREIEVLEVIKIERIYRFAIKVEKKSCLDIVGLTVNR